jgi:hypothetical protein
MASSYIAAKVAGPVLAVVFLGTLKPLFRQIARVLNPSLRNSFTAQVNALSVKSGVGGSAVLALLGGIAVWIAVAIALDSLAGDASTWIGAAAGIAVLYFYFFLIFYIGARRSLRATGVGRG